MKNDYLTRAPHKDIYYGAGKTVQVLPCYEDSIGQPGWPLPGGGMAKSEREARSAARRLGRLL